MRVEDTTVQSRELGERVRRLAERKGINGKQLARLMGWSESEVSRLFKGRRGITEGDLGTILGILGASIEEHVRDTKDRAGGMLTVDRPSWRAFLGQVAPR